MKRSLLFLFLLAVGVFRLTACDKEAPTSTEPMDAPGIEDRLFSYNGVKILYVPFLPQVPPGDWGGTRNCGQACAVMLGGYFNNGAVASWVIDSENDWMKCDKPNGCYTSSSSLANLLWGFHRLSCRTYYGRTVDDVLNEVVNNGNPTIVGVRISGGRLTSDPKKGTAHWALAVGYDGYRNEIILNDPGTTSGRNIHYSVSAFDASWATQNRVYMPVWK